VRKGAFTGADRRRIGWFELADGGTLLLDEIGDLPAPAQGDSRVCRNADQPSAEPRPSVNVHLIAATHRNLAAEVRRPFSRFVFRLHVMPIRLPPLRERSDDIGRWPECSLTASPPNWAARRGGSRRSARPLARSSLARKRTGPRISPSDYWCSVANEPSAQPVGGLLPDAVPDARAEADAAAPVIDDLSLWEQEHALLVRTGAHAWKSDPCRAPAQISREQLHRGCEDTGCCRSRDEPRDLPHRRFIVACSLPITLSAPQVNLLQCARRSRFGRTRADRPRLATSGKPKR
jgi:hypothetical protein